MRADDRVLLFAIPPDDQLASLGRILIRGVLVGIGTAEEVDRARHAMIEFDNTMFIECDEHRIPWRDAYFSKIVVPPNLPPDLENECKRVLSENGDLIQLDPKPSEP